VTQIKATFLGQTSAAKGIRGIEALPSARQDLVVITNDPETGVQTLTHAHFTHLRPPEDEILGYIVRGWSNLERE